MFRRLVTEHWQSALALALFILAAIGCLLQVLSVFRMPRQQADKRAAMALDDETSAEPAPAAPAHSDTQADG